MFRIEYFCGQRFGGWQPGEERFSSADAAEKAIDRRQRAELECEITPFRRRVRPV